MDKGKNRYESTKERKYFTHIECKSLRKFCDKAVCIEWSLINEDVIHTSGFVVAK